MCQIENIKNLIAQKYGFDNWDDYFECFRTTEPGRKLIQRGINKAIRLALLLSEVRHSCPKCILNEYEVKQRA
jgi:hypothetical protein